VIPQISVPASVIGVELLDPVWDLGFEYAELVHENVLWYSNSGFPAGYSHDGWLLGHALGGSGESFTGVVRGRPSGWDLEPGLRFSHATWGLKTKTPGTGNLTTVALSLKNLPSKYPRMPLWMGAPVSPLSWEITAEWNREKAEPGAFKEDPSADPGDEKDWWRVYIRVGI